MANQYLPTLSLEFMRLIGFKYDGEKAVYKLSIPSDEGLRVGKFTDRRKPHPDLIATMQRLGPDTCQQGEVKLSKETPITITEIEISQDQGRIGFKVYGQQEYANSHGTRKVTFPMKWDEHSDPKSTMPPEMVEKCHDLVHEIELFIKGKTSQPELDLKTSAKGELETAGV